VCGSEGMVVGRAGTLLLCALAIIFYVFLSVEFQYYTVAPPLVPNARVYEPLRDSKRFVVELPQGNQKN